MSNNRKKILIDLIKLNKPLNSTINNIKKINFDSEKEFVFVDRDIIITVLNKALSGYITLKDLEEWANLIECRDDIGFKDNEIQNIIFDLANPEINGKITKESILQIIKKLNKINYE